MAKTSSCMRKSVVRYRQFFMYAVYTTTEMSATTQLAVLAAPCE